MDIDWNKKIVVVDGRGPNAIGNRGFDRKAVNEKWYRYSGADLYEACLERGIQLITPDIYFRHKPAKAIYMRANPDGPNHEKEFKKLGVPFAVLSAIEQPLYLPDLYWNLEKRTRDYDHVFMFGRAMARLISPKTKFHLFLGHNIYPKTMRAEGDLRGRKYLTLINSNHRIRLLKRWYARVMHFVKPLPGLLNRELYLDRLEAIRYFSHDPDFDLYGNRWDEPIRYSLGKYDESVKKSYRGRVDDKFETLKKYKFSICFENCIFDGLVTEKIIDSFFAGCIPIYWGAPDVCDFVPEGSFIDFRKFNYDYPALENYLKNMDEKTYCRYVDNINKFIASKYYYNFSAEKYIKEITEIFNSYF